MINLTIDEKIKVVECAINFLKNGEDKYICHALRNGVEIVKNSETYLDGRYTNKLLTQHFGDLLIFVNDYIPKYISEYGSKFGIFGYNNFSFDGSAWFTASIERYVLFRIELLELYIKTLKVK